ncbi:venom prothrombin activator pseutarin-C non-catalytic subunit-like [Oculina patagonica]
MRSTIFHVFILYFTATEEIIAGCFSPLGLASRSIQDSQLSASTSMSDWQLPSAGRLNNTISSSSLGAWCAEAIDMDQWFQIDLLKTTNVSAIASQGDILDGNWVTEYSLNYSCDGVKWFSHTFQGAPVSFNANNDSGGVATNTLLSPITARFIRVRPLAWNQLGSICLRLELYGCQTSRVCPHPTQATAAMATTKATPHSSPVSNAPLTGDGAPSQSPTLDSGSDGNSHNTDGAAATTNATPIDCSYALGMQSGAINDSQIKASSFKSVWTRPSEARLHNQGGAQQMSLGGWCAEDSDMNPYLQVDLVNNSIITAIATQGLPAHGNLALRYKLNYSCDGKAWFEYQQGKIFDGYRKNLRDRRNTLPVPLKARFVRILPLLSGQYDRPCVQLEVYGCKMANIVCDSKELSNITVNPDQYSTQNTRIQTTNQATLTTNRGRPTRQKDMIVIVRGRDQGQSSNNSAGYNSIRKTFVFLTCFLLMLNFL